METNQCNKDQAPYLLTFLFLEFLLFSEFSENRLVFNFSSYFFRISLSQFIGETSKWHFFFWAIFARAKSCLPMNHSLQPPDYCHHQRNVPPEWSTMVKKWPSNCDQSYPVIFWSAPYIWGSTCLGETTELTRNTKAWDDKDQYRSAYINVLWSSRRTWKPKIKNS